jgi:hypothetical protein
LIFLPARTEWYSRAGFFLHQGKKNNKSAQLGACPDLIGMSRQKVANVLDKQKKENIVWKNVKPGY